MSSGNSGTEHTRREAVHEEDVLAAAHLVSNRVLRLALAIAAREYVQLKSGGAPTLPDAAVAVRLCWVMEAAEKQGTGNRD